MGSVQRLHTRHGCTALPATCCIVATGEQCPAASWRFQRAAMMKVMAGAAACGKIGVQGSCWHGCRGWWGAPGGRTMWSKKGQRSKKSQRRINKKGLSGSTFTYCSGCRTPRHAGESNPSQQLGRLMCFIAVALILTQYRYTSAVAGATIHFYCSHNGRNWLQPFHTGLILAMMHKESSLR